MDNINTINSLINPINTNNKGLKRYQTMSG